MLLFPFIDGAEGCAVVLKGHAGYDVDNDIFSFLGYEASMTMASSSPPPPYEWPRANNHAAHMQQQDLYEQQSGSQTLLPATQPKTPRKKKSAWTSTTELRRDGGAQLGQQRQGWHSTNNIVAASHTKPIVRAAACLDTVAERLHDVLCRVDRGGQGEDRLESLTRELSLDEPRYTVPSEVKERSSAQRNQKERTRVAFINIQKSWMYANSRLPPHMLPYRAYLASWQIYCKAAEASSSVYQRPKTGEREDYVEANWRRGTKAMVLKSVAQDHDKVIVIAIRGSQWNVIDWAVNFTVDPKVPSDFLDDENPCHEGFLQVARSMVRPVAARLRQLVEQDPSRHTSSLLFTGHSAGGAVANLLYLHMLSQKAEILNGVFKRVHCVTFGVPPMALLPLQNPAGHRHKRNEFVSFINEGDPIARADFDYMKSLASLYTTSAPESSTRDHTKGLRQKMSRQNLKAPAVQPVQTGVPPIWPLPSATLSNAGRLVLLREKPGHRTKVEAVCTSDEQLRGGSSAVAVIFGDPVMHHMEVYERRVQNLAITSVTGKEVG
ncbi:uncharacterized protein LTR77_001115 [Saxophila tyrrhenica]|uniref:Fungal lipase-type domain-containing protein n=1 Tax=Saxophila tyrrhenica TaxID=1690608 RepID=A0AAV9PK64_9PEZI|nr:hypothetical protein LTR77_001115 [Saxophila tyrrhenica]